MIYSLILRTAARLLVPLLLLFSIFLMLRGHNEAGGGFIGGLVAASSFALYAVAYGTEASRRTLQISPLTLMSVGLATAALAGILPLFIGEAFLTGLWLKVPIGGDALLKLGSPVLFDIGVYLLVCGMGLTLVYELDEDGRSLFPRERWMKES